MVIVNHEKESVTVRVKDIIQKDLSDDYEVTDEFYEAMIWMVEWLRDYHKFEKRNDKEVVRGCIKSMVEAGNAVRKK